MAVLQRTPQPYTIIIYTNVLSACWVYLNDFVVWRFGRQVFQMSIISLTQMHANAKNKGISLPREDCEVCSPHCRHILPTTTLFLHCPLVVGQSGSLLLERTTHLGSLHHSPTGHKQRPCSWCPSSPAHLWKNTSMLQIYCDTLPVELKKKLLFFIMFHNGSTGFSP